MTKEEYRAEVGRLRVNTQKSINNTFIWCSAAHDALEAAADNLTLATEFEVPSKEKPRSKIIKRQGEAVQKIFRSAIHQDLYYSVFVFVVAKVEAFLFDLVSLTLNYDSRRLKTKVQGIDQPSKVEVAEVIDCASREELISRIIERELTALFYAGPAAQFEYLRRVVGVDVPEPIQADWLEFKATRDLIVHNSGVVNQIYIAKSGSKARASLGESIVVDKDYFSRAVGVTKSLVGQCSSQLQRKLKPTSTKANQNSARQRTSREGSIG